MKKVSLLLVLSMVLSLSAPVFGEPIAPTKPGILISPRPSTGSVELVGFRDVPENHWAYAFIMEMTEQGIFAGTTAPDANGIALFSPDSTMTRAQFVTLINRICDLQDNRIFDDSDRIDEWYYEPWKQCTSTRLLGKDELGGLSGMNEPITREEMGLIIARVLDRLEGLQSTDISTNKIPDYSEITKEYRSNVLICYGNGILTGVDNQGTFNPKGVLTRAQGAAVIYRVLNPDARIKDPNVLVLDVKGLSDSEISPEEFIGTRKQKFCYDDIMGNYDRYEMCFTDLREYKEIKVEGYNYTMKYKAKPGCVFLIFDTMLYGYADNNSAIDLSNYYLAISKTKEFYSQFGGKWYLHYMGSHIGPTVSYTMLEPNTVVNGYVIFEVPEDMSKDLVDTYYIAQVRKESSDLNILKSDGYSFYLNK